MTKIRQYCLSAALGLVISDIVWYGLGMMSYEDLGDRIAWQLLTLGLILLYEWLDGRTFRKPWTSKENATDSSR